MTKSKPVMFMIVALIVIVFYGYYNMQYSNARIVNNVTNQEGYSLTLKTERVPTGLLLPHPAKFYYMTSTVKR